MRRTYERDRCCGIPLAIGPELILFLHGSPEGYEGFEVSFLSELRSVERIPTPYERFIRRALKLRGVRRPRNPRPPLDSIESLLRWLQPRFDAVTLFRPLLYPDECRIAKLIDVSPRYLRLQDIDPSAAWSPVAVRHRIVDIRRVEWGASQYVQLLLMVGGPPPTPLDPYG
jgi:hypothetical protein